MANKAQLNNALNDLTSFNPKAVISSINTLAPIMEQLAVGKLSSNSSATLFRDMNATMSNLSSDIAPK